MDCNCLHHLEATYNLRPPTTTVVERTTNRPSRLAAGMPGVARNQSALPNGRDHARDTKHFKMACASSPGGSLRVRGNALSEDFADYSRIYGDSMNKQLLLNLARESHNEPVYFIQLASISSQYQFTTSTGFNASHTRTAPPNQGAADEVQNALTLGGTINAGVQQTPVFSFLPLNGATYAQTLATPIPAKVFNELYDQGFPADMLLRVMVDEIRIKGGAPARTPSILEIIRTMRPIPLS